jgi:uncharacterized protein (DUF2141 family)
MLILLSVLNLFLSDNPRLDNPNKTNLKVEIQNVRQQKGAVHVGLYRACPNFPSCQPVELKVMDVKGNSLQVAFSVEPGDYAIAVYHDENSNGQMDKRVFGIPKEPYGFSNNFRPVMSAPKFNDCKFSVGDAGKAISIKLN